MKRNKASPSKIPISISLTSSGNSILALSEEDRRSIPFVERMDSNTRLGTINNTKERPKLILC